MRFVFLMELFLLAFKTKGLIETSIKHTEGRMSVKKNQDFITLRAQSCYFGKSRNTGVHIARLSPDFDCQKQHGEVGTESEYFYRSCQNLCEHHFRKMSCHMVWINRRRAPLSCSRGSSLGSARAPSCCFYRRCFQLLPFYTKRPKLFQRRRHKAWKILLRKGCM